MPVLYYARVRNKPDELPDPDSAFTGKGMIPDDAGLTVDRKVSILVVGTKSEIYMAFQPSSRTVRVVDGTLWLMVRETSAIKKGVQNIISRVGDVGSALASTAIGGLAYGARRAAVARTQAAEAWSGQPPGLMEETRQFGNDVKDFYRALPREWAKIVRSSDEPNVVVQMASMSGGAFQAATLMGNSHATLGVVAYELRLRHGF